jgi:hypothetical protein
MISSKKVRWAVLAARMGEILNTYAIFNGIPEGKRHLDRLTLHWRTILKWIF